MDLLDYFLKWLIPFTCAGLFSLLAKPLIKNYTEGRKAITTKIWNENSSAMQKQIDALVKQQNELKEKIQQIEQNSKDQEVRLKMQIQETEDRLLAEIRENTTGIRGALLTIHLHNLITDSKMYFKRGYITLDEWADYNHRYDTYKLLGGNGHMEPWYEKIGQLPNRASTEETT